MKKEILHEQIRRYFEGETTLSEERELMCALLELSEPDETEREALAVMGYAKLKPDSEEGARPAQRHKQSPIAMTMKIAASLIAVVAVGIGVVSSIGYQSQNVSFAYVGGVKTESHGEIIQLIRSDMAEMTTAATGLNEEVRGSLGEMGTAFSDID